MSILGFTDPGELFFLENLCLYVRDKHKCLNH